MQTPATDKRLNEARELVRQHSFSEAVTAYEKLTRICPHMAQIWFEYACAAAGAGQMDLTDRSWQRAQELEPGNLELQLQMGHHSP
ncbi:MAG TPA: hypothetical protein VMQ67_00095, partial [Candidatus Saccharimonadales bacterium]|nr:hypothetical protein [Candidatus Saccharimonadales bacterium]